MVDSNFVYIMSGVHVVNSSTAANDLRSIFDSLSYGPAPEADNVAQVVVHFNCHVSVSLLINEGLLHTMDHWASYIGTCEASRFESISNRTSDSGFDS